MSRKCLLVYFCVCLSLTSVLSLLSTLLQLTKFNIREVSTSKRVQFQKALLCIWMHFCREQSLKFMRDMPESRLLQLANSTDILVSVENYQSCYLELLSMNTSRYGLSNNDMFCSSGFIKLCNIGNCRVTVYLQTKQQ